MPKLDPPMLPTLGILWHAWNGVSIVPVAAEIAMGELTHKGLVRKGVNSEARHSHIKHAPAKPACWQAFLTQML